MTYCYSCGLVSPEPPQTGYNQAVFNSWHEAVPEQLLESREKHAHAYFQRQGYLCYTLSSWVCPWVWIFGSHGVCLAHQVLQKRARQHPASLCRLWFQEQHSVSMVTCQNYYDFQSLLLCNWVWTSRLLQAGQGEVSYLQVLQGEVLST